MKIAHVAAFFYPEEGGMENAVLNQCRELVKLKNEVHVFTCDRYRNETKIYNKTAEIYGIKIHYLRSLFHIEKSHFFPSIFTEIDGTFGIVHTHAMHHYHNDLAALSNRIRHRKTVFTSHSSFFPKWVFPTYQYYLFKIYDATARLSIFRTANRVIALTKYGEMELAKRGLDPKRIQIIPNGVDSSYFEQPDIDFKSRYGLDGRVILYTGRLNKIKGLDILVNAFHSVLYQSSDVKLLLVGSDEGEAANIIALSEKLGIRDRVILTGPLHGRDLVSAYYCDVFALCSIGEAFGISLLEAQAAGKPCVASCLGGIPYVVKNGQTGFLVPPRNPSVLADKLNLLLGDDKLRSKMVAKQENGLLTLNGRKSQREYLTCIWMYWMIKLNNSESRLLDDHIDLRWDIGVIIQRFPADITLANLVRFSMVSADIYGHLLIGLCTNLLHYTVFWLYSVLTLATRYWHFLSQMGRQAIKPECFACL